MLPLNSTGMTVSCATARLAPARGGFVYRVARRMEAFSFAAAPEQFALEEGLRAAVAVASFVGLAFWLDRPILSWAAFGAFWTCLADPGGADRRRLTCMGSFAMAGSTAAFAGAAAGWAGMIPGGVAVLVLAFIAGLSCAYGSAAAQVGTLGAVVAVVAVAFPQPLAGALVLSLTFLLGAIGALVLCIGIWRIRPQATARRAVGAIYLNLGYLLCDVLELERHNVPAAAWTNRMAEHRRAVRGAIERARSTIIGLENEAPGYLDALDTADQVFSALVAVEHERISRGTALEPVERHLLHGLLPLLAETHRQTAERTAQLGLLAAEAAALCRAAGTAEMVIGRAVDQAARALSSQAEDWLGDGADKGASAGTGTPAHQPQTVDALIRPVPVAVVRHAARLAVAVVVAYGTAAALGLPFSYWTTMATVVVMQPASGETWPRSLERMLGSIVGGLFAALLASIAQPPVLLLAVFPIATATIALRRVNYTLFVVAVTCLFVLVAELLLPAIGIPAARAINNVIGSLVGTAAALFLWPERGAKGFRAQLADAVDVNLALAAQAIEPENAAAFNAARRAAGLVSTTAEIACRRLMLSGQSHRAHFREAASLLATLRTLAGAAVAHAVAGRTPDPNRAAVIAERASCWANALRDPAAAAILPMPARLADDKISETLDSAAKAVASYLSAGRPPSNLKPTGASS
ncbi:FUSC family protein [Brucella intermedia]|uniref:FUSC family protein n=1 Tax=Brucella intermedia TaxID=94625 RepID=UPI0023611145|nr:FUSC family protein [Brucella intermedia]